MDDMDRLRRLAFNLASAHDDPSSGYRLQTTLEQRTLVLVRLGAAVGMGGGAVATYGALADEALAAGASVGDVVDVLVAVLPIVGSSRVVAAAPVLAMVLGDDEDDLPNP